MPRKNTIAKMLRSVTVAPSGCWVWEGARYKHGYGKVTLAYETKLVHRVFYEHFKGPIPEANQVDHLCKNRACVNPDHLEAVTPAENNARSASPSAVNALKALCGQGHALSGANLYLTPDSRRQCRSCRAKATSKYTANYRGADLA